MRCYAIVWKQLYEKSECWTLVCMHGREMVVFNFHLTEIISPQKNKLYLISLSLSLLFPFRTSLCSSSVLNLCVCCLALASDCNIKTWEESPMRTLRYTLGWLFWRQTEREREGREREFKGGSPIAQPACRYRRFYHKLFFLCMRVWKIGKSRTIENSTFRKVKIQEKTKWKYWKNESFTFSKRWEETERAYLEVTSACSKKHSETQSISA